VPENIIGTKQTIVGDGKGNCFAACLSSIFRKDLSEIPKFEKLPTKEAWGKELVNFTEKYGLTPIVVEGATDHPKSLGVGVYATMRGTQHCVVMDAGEISFDPAPDGHSDLFVRLMTIYFVAKNPGKLALEENCTKCSSLSAKITELNTTVRELSDKIKTKDFRIFQLREKIKTIIPELEKIRSGMKRVLALGSVSRNSSVSVVSDGVLGRGESGDPNT
jgi:hypothetical protein